MLYSSVNGYSLIPQAAHRGGCSWAFLSSASVKRLGCTETDKNAWQLGELDPRNQWDCQPSPRRCREAWPMAPEPHRRRGRQPTSPVWEGKPSANPPRRGLGKRRESRWLMTTKDGRDITGQDDLIIRCVDVIAGCACRAGAFFTDLVF